MKKVLLIFSVLTSATAFAGMPQPKCRLHIEMTPGSHKVENIPFVKSTKYNGPGELYSAASKKAAIKANITVSEKLGNEAQVQVFTSMDSFAAQTAVLDPANEQVLTYGRANGAAYEVDCNVEEENKEE